jgi:gamma-glutamyl-gamma-aminobutyrate hydrolase PuuD
MTSAPLILISPSTHQQGAEFDDYSLSLSAAYPKAIVAAGGIPWVSPCSQKAELISEMVRRCDGVLLSGGDDISPALHTARLSGKLSQTVGATDAARDCCELLLIQEVFHQRKPLLAICRGHQLLNVAFGGALFVDIPTQKPDAINHRRTDLKDQLVHEVRLAPDSLLSQIFGRSSIRVNSCHHQAVSRLAGLFQATGLSPDGIIEGFELDATSRHVLPYLVSVQFHPERLFVRHPQFTELFRSFVEACAAERKRSV